MDTCFNIWELLNRLCPEILVWALGVNRKHLTVIGVYFIEKVNVLQHEFKRAPGSASLLPNIFDIFSDARRDKKVDCKTTLSNRQRAVKMTLLTGSAVWRRSLRLTASRTVPVGVKATYWKAYCATINTNMPHCVQWPRHRDQFCACKKWRRYLSLMS